MSNLMSAYRSIVKGNEKDSPKPSSGGTQRSNTSLTKVQPWLYSDSLELISNPGSAKGTRKLIQPFVPDTADIQAFKPAKNALPAHFTNGALEDLNATDDEGQSLLHRAVRINDVITVRALLDNGADINIKDRDGFTPVHAAVRLEKEEIVKLLLERGADPAIPNNHYVGPVQSAARKGNATICRLVLKHSKEGALSGGVGFMQPLHLACMSDSREVVELFLSNGADVTTDFSYTALHVACFRGNEEICELLIKTASMRLPSLTEFVNHASLDGFTALHIACEGGHERVIDLLLRHGADHEAVTHVAADTPLHSAAKNGHLASVELLVLHGSITDCRNGKLRTPLHSAASYNHCRIVEVLLDSGADPEARDELEMTPLLSAVTNGSVEAAKLLLERGVEITATDSSLNSVLHWAIKYRNPEMVKVLLEMDKDCVLRQTNDKDLKTVLHLAAGLESSKILEILLENKVCVRGRDISEKLPLHIAAETGSFDCVMALSKRPRFTSHLHDREERGMTALHLAAGNGHTKTCQLLLSKGADVTAKESNHLVPLHLATKAGSLKTVQVLLDSLLPSTLEERDDEQNTALHIACRYNHVDVLQFLLDKGADVTARNARNMTCLDIAIEWEFAEVAKALVNHERWEEVLQLSPDTSVPPVMQLIGKLPDVAEAVLDKCVTLNDLPPSHEDFCITFNFRHLDPGADCICFGPATMAKHRRERLLKHVVTQALLRYKWMILGKFLTIFNSILFLIFVVMFSWLVVKERDRSALFSDASNSATGGNEVNQRSTSERTAAFAIFVFLIFQTVKEGIQLSYLRFAYFKDPTNLLELAMVAMIWVFLLPLYGPEGLYSSETQWNAGLIGLFLSYINLTLNFRRFGGLGLYVTMYVEVFWTFLKVISTFLTALIGYSLVFYLLLGHQGNFSSFIFALGKIHVMMLGELDYTDMLVDRIVNNDTVPGTNLLYVPLPALTVALFFIFVLMVSVVLVNLLVGLAVGDIESIQRTASLRTLIDDALLVEGMMRSYPKWFLRRIYKTFLEIKPNQNAWVKRIALAGTDITDQDNFMDKLLNYRIENSSSVEDWRSQEQMGQEKQLEIIRTLQATVENQGKLLKAMADRLKISDIED